MFYLRIMFKVITCFLLLECFELVWSMGDHMIAKGIWEITSVEPCDNEDQFVLKPSVERRKMNRTHYGFGAQLDFSEILDANFNVEIVVCKWVDGGCKQYQVIKDDNINNFSKKVAEKNTKAALEMLDIEGGEFPIQAGQYELSQFILDTCEFPCESVIGTFTGRAAVKTMDGVEKGCMMVTVDFREPEDGEQLCEKCQE